MRSGDIVVRMRFAFAIAGILAAVAPATVFAAELHEGTRVSVRLQGVINSETSRVGQPITFVVITDVLVGDSVVIKRDTPVMGVVVRARRMRWGFLQHRPRLAFKFSYTTLADGRVIGLRSSPQATGDPQVVTYRGSAKGAAMLWAGGADVFEAYVDGNYEI